MVNPPPCQVKAMPLHPINTPSGQVGVTPHKSEGIEPFTMINSPPCQVGAMLIMSLTMKFTLRMTRHLLIVTFTCSLAQSSVSFMNSSMIYLARGSSDHPSHQQVCLSSL